MSLKLSNNGYVVEYISTQPAIDECVEFLSTTSRVALDLEFDRDRNAYGFNLCLIQACAGNRCFIIDPLEQIDCNGFYRLLENPTLQVLLHSHGEDLRLLHSLKCWPANVVDTEIAAKLLGFEKTSLAALLDTLLHVTLDKSQQKTNWLQRPLTPAQILYASNDVIHLAALKDLLTKEAEKKNLGTWINQENEALSKVVFTETVKESFLTAKDTKEFSPYHQFILNEWLKLRDGLAAKFNKPSYQVISPETIRDISTGKEDVKNWTAVKGVYGKLKTNEYSEFFIRKHTEFIKAADSSSLSRSLREKKYLSPAEWETRKQFNAENERIKAEVFMPIKQRIVDIYGAGAASFILSNSLAEEFISGNLKLADLKPDYRKELIHSIASELKIDLAPYC